MDVRRHGRAVGATPVLNVLGAGSAPRFVEGAEIVQRWFPRAERFTLPGAGHLLLVENAEALAAALGAFFARHPIELQATVASRP